jgi:hypothetical protein
MKAAQFYKGKIGGFEQTFETSNLIDILDIDKIGMLEEYSNTNKPYQRFFRAERVIAKVEAYAVTNGDESGRSGLQVRGILYKFDRTITHDDLPYTFPEEYFIEFLQGKKLKMPPLPELKKPLDPPPPIAWEA